MRSQILYRFPVVKKTFRGRPRNSQMGPFSENNEKCILHWFLYKPLNYSELIGKGSDTTKVFK